MIQLVIHALTTRRPLTGSQSLIVDYQGIPVLYNKDGEALLSDDMAALGEADVKFVRYCDMYRNLQVDSVDGDCVPIALLKMETGHKGNITILRMETKLKEDKPKPSGSKRGQPEQGPELRGRPRPPAVNLASAAVGQVETATDKKKPGRVYEYVHINKIFTDLCTRILPNTRTSEPKMSMLATLICLTGTDFTRHLPLVGANTIFNIMDNIWKDLEACYDKESGSLVADIAADLLVSKIYNIKFANHTKTGDLGSILDQLKASKLSDKTKLALPTTQDIRVTIRNINWVVGYWRMQTYPDPIQDQFGFTKTSKGATTYCTE